MRRFDVVVIGGGSAGFAAARQAVSAGAKVAVVEGAKKIGGLCILRGCMPTKALLESSHRWQTILRAKEFGLKVKPVKPDLTAIMRRKDRLIADFASYRRKQLEAGTFDLVRGAARFLDAHTLGVTNQGQEEHLAAKAFVIATGSEVTRVLVPGLREAGYWTSDEAIVAKRLPKRLAVLGGGVVAVELGQFFAQLGVEVTLLQRSSRLVKDYDEDVSTTLANSFRDDGIKVLTGTQLSQVTKQGKAKVVYFLHEGKRRKVVADEILYALGRQPQIEGLHLAAAGVHVAGTRVGVDEGMQTSAPHIFAAGDVTGRHEIVHIAVQQGEVAGVNAAQVASGGEGRKRVDERLIASAVFTEPQIASVGLTEQAARAAGLDYVTASYPFNDHGKSLIMGARHGFVKLLAEKTRGEIIGAQIIGPQAADLIHELIAVMHYRGTAAELAAMPHYHPTLAEIITYPAEEITELLAKKN